MQLVKAIRETQGAAENATKELVKTIRRYELSPEQAEREKWRLEAETEQKTAAAKEKAGAWIDAKIAELDAAEVRAAERRAKDTDYMNRLQMKIGMIGSVDLQKMTDETLKAMFAEFENDSFALEMIRAAISGARSIRIEPANANGKKQAHLQDVKKAVFRAIEKAGAFISPRDLESGVIPWKSEVDALVQYIVAQNDDFSKDDAAIWERVALDYPELKVYAGAWQMRFSNSR